MRRNNSNYICRKRKGQKVAIPLSDKMPVLVSIGSPWSIVLPAV